ncbi:MAG: acyl transferase [Saprospiraceae bacterium]|nr:acyl transferase [Saprospiraceae bacterium]
MNVQNDVLSRYAPGSSTYADQDFDFETSACEVFQYQSIQCAVFHEFLNAFGWPFDDPVSLQNIPFLPVEAFKYHEVMTSSWNPEGIFRSSGTQGGMRSRHLVRSLDGYRQHTSHLFSAAFGALADFQVFALLPNYLEAGDSSLVHMVRGFMQASGQKTQHFYLHDFESLHRSLQQCGQEGKRVLLFGVTFALLDFATEFPMNLPADSIVIETGGMKGRGQELSRSDLHRFLGTQFNLSHIFSEYGMTELMSQAYSDRNGHFFPPASMRVVIKEISDPMVELPAGKVGVIHIIDLANVNTCSFIATADLGIKHDDGSFEVIGRLEQSDLRGCHLMYV